MCPKCVGSRLQKIPSDVMVLGGLLLSFEGYIFYGLCSFDVHSLKHLFYRLYLLVSLHKPYLSQCCKHGNGKKLAVVIN